MMVAIENVGERKSFSGMSASSFMNISMMMNARMPSGADHVAGDRRRAAPAPGAALLCDEQQGHQRDDDGGRTPPVDAHGVALVFRQVQESQHDEQCDDADRHVDQEHPAPAGDAEDLARTGEEAADQRADQARDAEDGEEVALVFRSLTRGEHVAHDGERHGHQTAGAQALDGAEDGEFDHRGREAREDRADDEDDDREDEQRAASVDVGQFSVDRRGDRGDDQVGRRDPRLLAEPVEVVADGADGRADHGLVEGGEEHARHQAEDHEEDLPVGHDSRGWGWRSSRICL